MDRLGFFKHGFSALMDAATSVIGMKKAVESMTEAVDEALSNIQTDVCLHLPSLEAKMYEDAENTLAELAHMGYTSLEVGAYYGDTIHDQKVGELKEMIHRHGMKAVSAHLYREYKPEPTEAAEDDATEAVAQEVAECGDAEESVTTAIKPTAEQLWWSKALDVAAELGCQSVVMAGIPAFPVAEMESMAQTYADYFMRVAEMATERGLKLCYHPAAAELKAQDAVSFFDLIAAKCDATKLWFQIDTLEALEANVDICSLLKQYKGRIESLHLHDRGVVCDSGEIDFEHVMKCGQQCGVQRTIIEQRHFTLPPMNCIERSLQGVLSLPSMRL